MSDKMEAEQQHDVRGRDVTISVHLWETFLAGVVAQCWTTPLKLHVRFRHFVG